MRVCFLLSGAIFGGAESVLLQLVSALNKNEIICILFAHGTLYDQLMKLGVRTYYLNESTNHNINLIINIRKILIKEDISIIHSHCIKESIIAGIATIGVRTKNIATVHGIDEFSSTNIIKRLYNSFKQELQRVIFALRYKAVVIVSPSLIKYFERYNIRNKITVIRNGIIKQEKKVSKGRSLLNEVGVDCDRFIVGIIGRICLVKNQECLVDLIIDNKDKLKDIEFVFVGEGSLLNILREKAKYLDNVYFLGFRTDIVHFISSFDLLINPSFQEGSPIVLMEALMLKVPILASDVPGNNEIINNNENGLLFNLKKSLELIDKLMLLKSNPKLRKSISDNGYLTYINECTVDRMAEKYNMLYLKVLRENT